MKYLHGSQHLLPVKTNRVLRQHARLGATLEERRQIGVSLLHHNVERVAFLAVLAVTSRGGF